MEIVAKRIYEDYSKADGYRVLVDRLWPRGVSKESAKIDLWAKDITPSNDLRKWFHEDRDSRYAEFKKRYAKELKDGDYLQSLKGDMKGKKRVTLLTAAKEVDRSHVPVLMKNI